MDYLKVALRTDLAAEDTSQAAPRAIIHLIGALSRETFCGKAAVRDVTHAGSDRVVSCGDCLSLSRSMRESPADNTSLIENVSRILRHVSGPDYSGIERRSRPRFIHHEVPTTGEEAMKHYTNVARTKQPPGEGSKESATVHALYDGDSATVCGALNAADTGTTGQAVSCEACMKAIMNQNRAYDHRAPAPVPVLHHNFSTHKHTWRAAIATALAVEKDPGQRAFWQHELDAFDLAYSTFDNSMATGGDDMPKVIHHGGPVPNTPINAIKILAYGQDGRIVQAGTRSSRNPLRDFEILLNTPAQHMNADIAMNEVRDIIDNCNSRMVGDGSGEREYILSAEDIEKLRGLRDAFIAENIIAAQKIVNDADLLAKLYAIVTNPENACTAIYNREQGARIEVIPRQGGVTKMREYLSTSFHQAINVAADKELNDDLPPGYKGMASIHPVVSVDAVVEANRKLLLDRSTLGIRKYGVTLEKSGLSQKEIVQHAIEEALDLANYLQTFLQHPAAQ
jgi:hypothetical protein